MKHIYPIRNEEIISELTETDVRIGKLELDIAGLKSRVSQLNDLIINRLRLIRPCSKY